MPAYIQLLRLSSEGRAKALDDPDFLIHAQSAIGLPGIEVLGIYGVLGEYDFVNIVEAPDNDAVARFSMELGVRAGAHITTMPAIPVARLEPSSRREPSDREIGVGLPPQIERQG